MPACCRASMSSPRMPIVGVYEKLCALRMIELSASRSSLLATVARAVDGVAA